MKKISKNQLELISGGAACTQNKADQGFIMGLCLASFFNLGVGIACAGYYGYCYFAD